MPRAVCLQNKPFMWTSYVSESERNTYSFDAHAIEHVENILCCNISRWALSVWATSQASYCGIDHTDPHLQKHTQTHSTPLLRYCPGTAVLLSCSALFHLCFSAVGEKLWPRVSENEWTQLKDSSLILLLLSIELRIFVHLLQRRAQFWVDLLIYKEQRNTKSKTINALCCRHKHKLRCFELMTTIKKRWTHKKMKADL